MKLTDKEIIDSVGDILNNVDQPLKDRFRALFTLRNIGGKSSIEWIEKCFSDTSGLLKHECAYCLGQMQDPLAVPKLESLLSNTSEEPVVRHEAAEALAAIGLRSSIDVLKAYLNDPIQEVAETCQLAVQKMQDENIPDDDDDISVNPYNSVDPTPPFHKKDYRDINDLENMLLDENQSLYNRYRAMFTLRNMNTESATSVLVKGLKCGSALFRHEIAYVLGQMQIKSTIPQLSETLMDEKEHEMVRHECAEALGSIASKECYEILKIYVNDDKRIVRESCEVALDMCESHNGELFEFAKMLMKKFPNCN